MKLQEYLEIHTIQMQECFYLNNFSVTILYDKDCDCSAEIDTDYRYLEAEISYGKRLAGFWETKQYKPIIRTLAHELMHLVTGQLSRPFKHFKQKRESRAEIVIHFDEQVTELTSRIAMKAYIHFLIQRPQALGINIGGKGYERLYYMDKKRRARAKNNGAVTLDLHETGRSKALKA